jgi:hypothetical protein
MVFIGKRCGEGFFALAFSDGVPVTESWRPRDGAREFGPEGGGVTMRLFMPDVKFSTAPRSVFSLFSLSF